LGYVSVIVSVRVRREVKEVLERAGVNISGVVREFLENLAHEIMVREEVVKLHELIVSSVKPSVRGFAERSVREDRDSH